MAVGAGAGAIRLASRRFRRRQVAIFDDIGYSPITPRVVLTFCRTVVLAATRRCGRFRTVTYARRTAIYRVIRRVSRRSPRLAVSRIARRTAHTAAAGIADVPIARHIIAALAGTVCLTASRIRRR